jgi:hypothetical protein
VTAARRWRGGCEFKSSALCPRQRRLAAQKYSSCGHLSLILLRGRGIERRIRLLFLGTLATLGHSVKQAVARIERVSYFVITTMVAALPPDHIDRTFSFDKRLPYPFP